MQTDLALELWLEALASEGRAPTTVQNYRVFCRPLPEVMPLLASGQEPALRRHLAAYAATHAPESVRSVFVAWRSFGNWCVREGLIDVSPVAKLRKPRTPEVPRDPYSRGQLQALVAHLNAQRTPIGLRNLAICSVLLDTGLRASELCRLAIDDLTEGGAVLLVRKAKSGRPRIAPLGQRSHAALARYLALGRPRLKPKASAIFVNQFGDPINRYGLRQILGRMDEAVGFHVHAHRFRNTFAYEHLKAGTPTETLRVLGGWADHSMVKRYAALLPTDLRAAQLRGSPLDGLR